MATRGSIWGLAFDKLKAELEEQSLGELVLNIHFGRPEGKLLEHVKTGMYDAVCLTGTGLGNILPEAFIFPLPLLFSGHEELDYVRTKLTQRFRQNLEKEGYVLLGWVEFGFIYLFSNVPIKTQTDFRNTRFWAWDLDPVAREFVSRSGGDPVVLPIQSVLSSLRTGEVQTVYNSPLACLAFGWHTQVKYMSDLPLAAGIGATVINKREFDGLSEEHKRLLRETMWEYHEQLIETVHTTNEESIEVLKDHGITMIHIPAVEREKWSVAARQAQDQFMGELYPEELLDEVRSLLSEYRARR